MTITKQQNGTAVTFLLDGWLDTLSSPLLEEQVNALAEAGSIILDFDKVEYISSAGLRQIVATHRKANELGASFSVINVGNEVMSILRLTGLEKKLDIRKK